MVFAHMQLGLRLLVCLGRGFGDERFLLLLSHH